MSSSCRQGALRGADTAAAVAVSIGQREKERKKERERAREIEKGREREMGESVLICGTEGRDRLV